MPVSRSPRPASIPDRDVKWLIVPLPQMAEALRQKKIDIGVFPTTFAFLALQAGRGEEGVRFRRHQRHRGRVRRRLQPGFRQEASGGRQRLGVRLRRRDEVSSRRSRPRRARSLIDSGIVQTEPKVYLSMTAKDDLLRTVEATQPGRRDVRRLQDELIKVELPGEARRYQQSRRYLLPAEVSAALPRPRGTNGQEQQIQEAA